MTTDLQSVVEDIRACRACAGVLPHTPRPVVRVFPETRLLICGQAPGRRVHESGLPFTDPSGDRLRDWMGVDYETFYDDRRIGVAAQAFCYPGTAPKGGDYPPPPRCAELWRPRLLAALPEMELTLLRPGLGAGRAGQGQHDRDGASLAGLWTGDPAAAAPVVAQHGLAAQEPLVRGRGRAAPKTKGPRAA